MIKSIPMFTVICDNCRVNINEDNEIVAWSEEAHALEQALEADWKEVGGEYFCPDCYEYDDNDNLIIKNRKAE